LVIVGELFSLAQRERAGVREDRSNENVIPFMDQLEMLSVMVEPELIATINRQVRLILV
jgi:hypothetical protein